MIFMNLFLYVCNLKTEFIWGWVENLAGKGENAGYQHFLLFPQILPKDFFSGSLKVGLYSKGLVYEYESCC